MLNHNEAFTIIPQSDYRRMPWKNGLGETLEIVACRANDELLYRVSQAAVVEDGVFSDFSGLHRTLVLLSGQGMLLTHTDGNTERCHDLTQPLSMAKFAGGDVTHATLANGKIEDLNIMVREGRATSSVVARFAPDSFHINVEQDTLFNAFYANSDCSLMIELHGSRISVQVESQHTILFREPVKFDLFTGSGVVITIDQMVSP